MDYALALVEAYLRVNGYFTVSEYPVLEARKSPGGYRNVTDIDILAFRFPGAGHILAGQSADREPDRFLPDPQLGVSGEHTDMLVAEVKQGRAELNKTATDPDVLCVALKRFGCCKGAEAAHVVDNLLQRGRALTMCGHQIRLVAFGTKPPEAPRTPFRTITLAHVAHYLQDYLRQNWKVVRHVQPKDPAIGFLVALEKAWRGWVKTEPRSRRAADGPQSQATQDNHHEEPQVRKARRSANR